MRMLPTIALALLLAGPARASDDGGDTTEFFLTAVNLVILLGVLVWAGRKPIQSFFSDRRLQIQDELSTAAAQRDEAKSRHDRWERRRRELKAELAQLRNQSRQRAEAERDRILADAAAAAERVRQDTRAAIEQEVRRARAELRQEASDLAVQLAGGLLRAQVTDSDRERLMNEFIEKIESSGAPNGSGAGR